MLIAYSSINLGASKAFSLRGGDLESMVSLIDDDG